MTGEKDMLFLTSYVGRSLRFRKRKAEGDMGAIFHFFLNIILWNKKPNKVVRLINYNDLNLW